jgi:HlyD family secretion protein
MQAELKALQIDRSKKSGPAPSRWATRWIVGGVLLFLLLGAARFAYTKLNAATEVDVLRVHAESSAAAGPGVVLNATGYIIAAHRIEVASKVVGRVAWIGVEKADKVKAGQVLVRLEDDEYRAQLDQMKGQLTNLQAKLAELEHGSRPEEIAVARANLNQSKADLENAKVSLDRTRRLASEGVMAKQALDDAQAKYDSALAHVNSLQKTVDLAVLGPRQEQIDSMRGQV